MDTDEPLMQRKKQGVPAVVSIVLYIVCVIILGIGSGAFLQKVLTDLGGNRVPGSLVLAAVEGGLLIAALVSAAFMLRFADCRPFSDLGLGLRGRGKDMLSGALMAIVLYGVGFGLSVLLGAVEITGIHFVATDLLYSLFFYLLVALAEEIIVRGYILGRLLRTRLNRFVSLVLTAVLFAALHLANPHVAFLPVLNLVLAGILLGASYIYTRNLWFPIFLHWFWNWMQGPVLGYQVSGNDFHSSILTLQLSVNALINGGAFGFEGSLICTALMILSTLAIIGYYEKQAKFKAANLHPESR